jgi:hypothetical protein
LSLLKTSFLHDTLVAGVEAAGEPQRRRAPTQTPNGGSTDLAGDGDIAADLEHSGMGDAAAMNNGGITVT